MIAWSDVTTWAASVPAPVWAMVGVGNLLLIAVTWSVARRRLQQAGQRAGERARSKDMALTLASLVPAGLFWLMVLGGSLHGLVAFGRTTLGWRGGWEYLVPGTLDGVSVTFAMLAFRAVKRGKAPDRCYRVVWGAALASATINFAHEYGQSSNALAGGYVALLSLFGMFMFDEFLNQFEDGADLVRRENPRFGVRWLTWPTNTFLAAVAWRNHPPPEGTAGTVANAVANLNRVRIAKRAARHGARRPMSQPTGSDVASVEVVPDASRATATRPRPIRQVASPTPQARRTDDDVKVPSTANTVGRWVGTWVTMCQRPDLAWTSMQDDQVARQHFGLSSRQLRNVRYAATTGALRRRAQELGVELPVEFDEAFGDLIGA